MSAKQKKRFHCENHPERRAKGTCVSCGVKLCKECALIVRGVYYCFSPDCRPESIIAEVKSSRETAKDEQQTSDAIWRSLLLRATITIALCGVVFAVWALRELHYDRREISRLRQSRVTLIEELKKSNLAIRNLTMQSPPPVDTSRSFSNEKLVNTRKPEKRAYTPLFSPPPSNQSYRYYHFANGSPTARDIALTFDGGSMANAAEAILDTLASRSVRATMFLTGNFIRRYPEVVRRIVREGHECGNHTYSHPHFIRYKSNGTRSTLPEINENILHEQLLRAEDLFRKTTGSTLVPLWRAPYGEYNREVCFWAKNCGYLHIGWRQGKTWRHGLDSNDWVPDSTTPGYHSPEDFLKKVIALSKSPPSGINGGIILMHLGTERKQKSEQVHFILGTLIDTLRTGGYRFVKVSELVAAAGIPLASFSERSHFQ